MKRMAAMLLAMLMLLGSAAAEFDREGLTLTEGCTVIDPVGSVDTVYRLSNQPFIGQVDDGRLATYVDFVDVVDLERVLIRFTLSVMIYEAVQADQLVFTLDGKTYTIGVDCRQEEYDGTFMEDYTFCLTDASLPFLKVIARQKQDDPIPVQFLYEGETLLTGLMLVPGEQAAQIYDLYVDLGGMRQNLKEMDEYWPCAIEAES